MVVSLLDHLQDFRLCLVGSEKSLKVYTSVMIRSAPSRSHADGGGRWIEWEVLGSLILTIIPNVESHLRRASIASQSRVQSLGA